MRQAHRSVCHKHIDLFYPYVPRRNNQGPGLPTALAGITISLTVGSVCPPSLHLHLHPSRSPFGLLCAQKKRKTNSFPYKWSESLQPRDPAELQIFHLCLGALLALLLLGHYPLSFILLLSFSSSLSYLLISVDPLHLHLSFGLPNHHLTEKHPPTTLQPFTAPSVQSKITLLQS